MSTAEIQDEKRKFYFFCNFIIIMLSALSSFV